MRSRSTNAAPGAESGDAQRKGQHVRPLDRAGSVSDTTCVSLVVRVGLSVRKKPLYLACGGFFAYGIGGIIAVGTGFARENAPEPAFSSPDPRAFLSHHTRERYSSVSSLPARCLSLARRR